MRLRPFLTFILATVAWAMVGAVILGMDFAHPVAVGVVWLVGFVWLAGYIAARTEDADHLVKVWLGTLAVIVVVAVIGVAVIS